MEWRPRTDVQNSGIPEANAKDGLSPRAFLIGLGLCALLGIWLTYNRMVVQGPFMGWYFLDRGVLFVFFCAGRTAQPAARSAEAPLRPGPGRVAGHLCNAAAPDARMGDDQGIARVHDGRNLLCVSRDAAPRGCPALLPAVARGAGRRARQMAVRRIAEGRFGALVGVGGSLCGAGVRSWSRCSWYSAAWR